MNRAKSTTLFALRPKTTQNGSSEDRREVRKLKRCALGATQERLPAQRQPVPWMSQEVSKWLVSGL